ncbi:MAG: DUF1292 domain-containing protein [Clostridia bacterium]
MAEEQKHVADCECEECGEEYNAEDDVVILEDENGEECRFNFVTTIDYEGAEYIYLQPLDKDGEITEEQLEIYKVTSEEGSEDEILDPVDDELYEKLYDELMKLVDEHECDCEECNGEEHECECEEHECDCHK